MSSFKEKSQVFIIGLLIGLLVAGGFFIFKLDDYFKELNFYKHFAETFSSEKKTELNDEKTEEKKLKEKEEAKPIKKVKENNKEEKNSESDTIQKINKDSIVAVTDFKDEIVVKKDELVVSKTTEIINLNPIAKTNNAKDSLIHKVSGITEEKETKPFLNIEFWQSPLNYKGYKMSKYKLVIYGLSSSDPFKLFKIDDAIYLKSNSSVYKLDYSADFKPYEKTTDELILSKLK